MTTHFELKVIHCVLQTCIKRLAKCELLKIAENVFNVCDGIMKLHSQGRSFQAEPEAFMCVLAMLESKSDKRYK